MRCSYFRFDSKVIMDIDIVQNPKAYPVGTLGVDMNTGKVYVSHNEGWVLIGGQT